MGARVGGLVLLVIGAAAAGIGYAMALALLGQPVPGGAAVDWLRPFLTKIAAEAALPPGSDFVSLIKVGWGKVALAALPVGALIGLGGLWQVLTGRRSVLILIVVVGVIVGFAVATMMA